MHVIGHSKSIPSKLNIYRKKVKMPRGPINIGEKFILFKWEKNMHTGGIETDYVGDN